MVETPEQFERRKLDHIRIALEAHQQTASLSDLERLHFQHEAFPEINYSGVSIQSSFLKHKIKTPFLISSMTAGHAKSENLNLNLAKAASRRGWIMGVGSQRREINDVKAGSEWQRIRAQVPDLVLLGNLGASQLSEISVDKIVDMAERMLANGFIIHTNPLQEVLQKEGTTEFSGVLKKLEQLVKRLKIPVIVKEVGCGISLKTLSKLDSTGVFAVDLAGLGGTHWGRVEGARWPNDSLPAKIAKTFDNWGLSTTGCLLAARERVFSFEVWASGGVRNGLIAAKFLALGALRIGVAQPLMQAVMAGPDSLDEVMEQFETELKITLFCTGSKNIKELSHPGKISVGSF